MPGTRKSVNYRITFPNGKIYVGHDRTNTPRYFGSWNCTVVAADFTQDELRDFTLRKEILWESDTATWSEVQTREYGYIRDLGSNDPAKGYNRSPGLKLAKGPILVAEPTAIELCNSSGSEN